MDVSVLIVSFNTRELTRACLRSLFAETREVTFEVILVDNDSRDESAQMVAEEYPQVQLIASKENLGFGRANNLAGERAKGDYVLLLNSDTVVQDQAIDRIVAFARQHPTCGMYGGRTVFADGSLNPTSCWGRPTLWSEFATASGLAHFLPRSSFFNPRALGGWQRDTEREVDVISGAFLMLTREAWRKLEGFDTRFFMYGEDIDLCLRGRQLGYRGRFCPAAQIIHYGGASDRVRVDKMVKLFKAKAQLYRKHWRRCAGLGVLGLDLWALTRLVGFRVLSTLRRSRAPSYQCWRDIWAQRRAWRDG